MQTGNVFLTLTDLYALDQSQQIELGTVGVTADGRRFRYSKFGGTSTINAGLLLVTPAAPANSTGLALPTTNTTAQLSLGSRSLIVTNGATAVTLNQFQDGFLDVIGTNSVQSYRIAGNSADAVGNAAITVALYQSDALRNTTALANGTNTVNLRRNPYSGISASLTLANPAGVTITPVPNTATVTNYGWVQIEGYAFVSATSATKGQAVTQDTGGTAGFIMNVAAATSPNVGNCVESVASSTAEINLNIPG